MKFDEIKNYQLLIVGLFFSISLIICTNIGMNTLSRSGIDVTGSAQELITSDRVVWQMEVSTQDASATDAYNKLQKQVAQVKNYLLSQKIKIDEIDLQNTNSYPTYKRDPRTGNSTNEIQFYNFSQIIQVSSNDIYKIKDISLKVENLLTQGINIRSMSPSYFYSKLSDLKPKLLEEATKDAKMRAEFMLKNTGNTIGAIRSAKSGVFQITTPNSTDVSNYGINDTSTIKKKVTAVVQANFKIK